MTAPLIYVRCVARTADGAEVYDRKILGALRAMGVEVEDVCIPANTRTRTMANMLLHAMPPLLARYRGPTQDRLAYNSHRVVFSHEALLPYACEVAKHSSVALIFHNIWSEIDDQGRWSYLTPIRPLMKLHENRALQHQNITPVVLSIREGSIIDARRGAKHTSRYAPPGAPSAAFDPITRDGEMPILISGTFDWRLKRRDFLHQLKKIERECSTRTYDLYIDVPSIQGSKPLSSWNAASGFAIGLVPDRFLSGSKLKVLWYIANNAVVLCERDLLGDFRSIPDAEQFIQKIGPTESLQDARTRIADAFDPNRFLQFKKNCLNAFSWHLAATEILAAAQ